VSERLIDFTLVVGFFIITITAIIALIFNVWTMVITIMIIVIVIVIVANTVSIIIMLLLLGMISS